MNDTYPNGNPYPGNQQPTTPQPQPTQPQPTQPQPQPTQAAGYGQPQPQSQPQPQPQAPRPVQPAAYGQQAPYQQPQPQPQPRPAQQTPYGQQQAAQQAPYRQQPTQNQQAYATSAYRPSQMNAQPGAYRSAGTGQASHAAQTSTESEESKPSIWKSTVISGIIGAAIATVITLIVAAVGILPSASQSTPSTTIIGGPGNSTIITPEEDLTLPEVVAAKTMPSVVCIYVYSEQTSFSWFGPTQTGEVLSSLGSGVILSEDGYIITNNHVVEGESSLKVSLNGEQYDAELVGSDPSSDLAVIKVNGAKNLVPIEVGTSSDLIVGEWVMTVGSPYGMEQSVGSGIVSAVSRSSASMQVSGSSAIYANMIQTDAPINPGNSGGALVDKNGKLVGICTSGASYSGDNSGVGFAIPADYAIPIAEQIIKGETPSHAQLGVSLVSIDQATASRYNLPVDQGAYVTVAYAGAAEAGIKEGDIITKVDGKVVTNASDVILQVRSHKVGDTLPVEFNRNGEVKSVDVTLTSDTSNNASSGSSEDGRE